jgi:beta-lactam-binding protein with PASTA domain
VGLTVPDVVGMVSSYAEETLRSAGFSQVRIEFTQQAGCDPYTVVSQYPAGGTPYDANGRVVLNMCQGVVVPDVIGMHKDEAKAILEAKGFVLMKEILCDGRYPAGYVQGTRPGPGEEVSPGSEVTGIIWEGCSPGSSEDGVRLRW